ncbi:MAG TPA: carboxyl transferase domain-containing protein [Leptospiraceae bacterium]|nr:acetyl-CoA carboxylase carboxyltransferase subunit [Leptospirales bacterium]HMU82863.1 carboxyl transferase domain-containing protein [Leptospiraceae bacterium]HMY43984.1 carboxyl transferase domain-containing protein [Leptospiraceae bacterium]HNJ32946.1 carboxyl transferase domain-containing protein [Leptospiraceae bacterium]HNK99649.1 carboxyl transferase domain-containing protein [Leptospiraceae bacterium]
MASDSKIIPTLDNPFEEAPAQAAEPSSNLNLLAYEKTLEMGKDLLAKPLKGGGVSRIMVQHSKHRMTVFERIKVLTESEPNILFQNWGRELDGAGLVTGILRVGNRDVAIYGHDFTNRAGSMDATNGAKLARLIYLAGEQGIPLIGLNDSAGAYVPAGVGGLDGYSEAFCALRKISGVVPSIMVMFGFNAGGGSYLPRQGSFMIQPHDTFFGLTGPNVVKDVLGEEVTPDQLGGPSVHGQSGVVDLVAQDELGALRKALRLLAYLPDNNHSFAPFHDTGDPIDRETIEEDILLRRTFASPSGFNTPFDITLLIQQIVDHGEYFELQPQRAGNLVTCFGRVGGHVVGFLANNSAVSSGQIDINAAYKGARFIRFCNLYNIPVIFLEDTTGFLPGREQEAGGIVLAGRALLDSIIDLRVPRLLFIVRNAFGGAYASWNSYHTGADMVFAFPGARVAVMGPAGREYIYKDELVKARAKLQEAIKAGREEEGKAEFNRVIAEMNARYENELMNPKEALALGSISRIVMPGDSRRVLGQALNFYMRRYKPGPLSEPQREFH